MGTYIHAESDVCAADVLTLLVKKYCIESPVFDRIFILFDEFGRYIEFTANNPRVAGDASLQQIFLGCNQGLSVSFILLTSAEMIGARDGMGYYVKYYSDFGDYTRTITGLLVIGFVVIAVTFLFNKLQSHLLRWKR